MKNIIFCLNIYVLLIFSACQNKNEKKHTEYSTMNGSKLSEGVLTDNGKETGEWIYYGQDGRIEERGNYENGFKVGFWEFNYDSTKNQVEWTKYICDTSKGLEVSIPKVYKTSENRIGITLYAYNPEKPNEDIIFIIHEVNSGMSIDTFHKLTFEQIKLNSHIIEYSIEKAENDFGEFYSNYYVVKSEKSEKIWLLYNYIAVNNGKIFDITYKTEYGLPVFHKMIFSNILFHSFYNELHLLDPKATIRKISLKKG